MSSSYPQNRVLCKSKNHGSVCIEPVFIVVVPNEHTRFGVVGMFRNIVRFSNSRDSLFIACEAPSQSRLRLRQRARCSLVHEPCRCGVQAPGTVSRIEGAHVAKRHHHPVLGGPHEIHGAEANDCEENSQAARLQSGLFISADLALVRGSPSDERHASGSPFVTRRARLHRRPVVHVGYSEYRAKPGAMTAHRNS